MNYPCKFIDLIKFTLFLLTILLQQSIVYGQRNVIDSLKSAYSDIGKPPSDYYYRLGKAYTSISRDSSEGYYLQAIQSTDSDSLKAEALLGLGLLYFYVEPRNYIQANTQNQKAVEWARKFKNNDLLAKCLLSLANSQFRLNQSTSSLQSTLEAKKLLADTKDSTKLYSVNNKLAIAYYNNSNYQNSIKQFKIAESFARTDNEFGMININKAETYLNLELIDSAIICYQESLKFFRKINRNIDASLNGLSMAYLKQKKYDSALLYANRWLSYISNAENKKFQHYPYSMLGKIYFEKGDFLNSEQYYLKAINSFHDERKFNSSLRDTYQKLALINARKNDFKKAYEYQIQYQIQNDSLNKIADKNKLSELLQLHEFEKTENELKIKTEENEKVKWQNRALSWMSIAILTLAALISYLLFQKYTKRLNQERKEKSKLLDIKEELETNYNLLNKEFDQKNQDLISYSLQLINHKELLQTITVELKTLKGFLSGEQEKLVSSLLSTIKTSLSNEKDWDNFRNYFESIHHNFFYRLNTKYNNLTNTDQKIAALTILGLDNKQAASILDVEPESVKVSKNRLKKKLSLQAEDDLKKKLSEFLAEPLKT